MPVNAEYDEAADALYLYLDEGDIARTEDREQQGYAVDLAEDGSVIGIEVLNLARAPDLMTLARDWGFGDRLADAYAAYRNAVPTPHTYVCNAVQARTGMVIGAGHYAAFGGDVIWASHSVSVGDPCRQIREPEPV